LFFFFFLFFPVEGRSFFMEGGFRVFPPFSTPFPLHSRSSRLTCRAPNNSGFFLFFFRENSTRFARVGFFFRECFFPQIRAFPFSRGFSEIPGSSPSLLMAFFFCGGNSFDECIDLAFPCTRPCTPPLRSGDFFFFSVCNVLFSCCPYFLRFLFPPPPQGPPSLSG